MSRKTRRLGKGLDALLGDQSEGDRAESDVSSVKISKLRPNEFQARREFSGERLAELAESIRVHGVVQPVLVRETEDGYELVAGERRWRAARMAGLEEIPALVEDFTDREMMEIGLVENLQREDLSPIEEATAYRALQEEFGLTQAELAERIGMSRSQVANVLRLLQLPDEVQRMLQDGELGLGHAKLVLSVAEDRQVEAAERVVGEDLTVRQTEKMVGRIKKEARGGGSGKREADRDEEERGGPGNGEGDEDEEDEVYFSDVAGRLRRALGTRVSLSGGRKGRIIIEYYDYEDLDRIVDMILRE